MSFLQIFPPFSVTWLTYAFTFPSGFTYISISITFNNVIRRIFNTGRRGFLLLVEKLYYVEEKSNTQSDDCRGNNHLNFQHYEFRRSVKNWILLVSLWINTSRLRGVHNKFFSKSEKCSELYFANKCALSVWKQFDYWHKWLFTVIFVFYIVNSAELLV